jgi:hypothetical protein
VVYLILAVLVVEIAVRGRPSDQADSQGAFRAVDHRSIGPVLLTVLGVGLLSYAAWRVVEALSDPSRPDAGGLATRIGRAAIAAVYVALSVEVFELVAGVPSQGGPSEHPASLAATVLRWPFGPGLLGVLGLALGAAGIGLLVWGVVHDFSEDLEVHRMRSVVRASVRPLGALGNGARGLAVALVGASLVSSAVSDDPQHAKSLDAALQSLAGDSGGPELLGAVAVGFFTFALLSLIEAAYRRP